MEGGDEKEQEKKILSLLGIASEVVAAYVSNNSAPSEELSALIVDVYRTLSGVVEGDLSSSQSLHSVFPAVPIAESITEDYLVCLEDGKKMKMLKRYLRSTYNMTPMSIVKDGGCLTIILWLPSQIMHAEEALASESQ